MDQLPALSALKTLQDGTNFTAYVNDDRLLQGRTGCLAPKKEKKLGKVNDLLPGKEEYTLSLGPFFHLFIR